MSGKESRLCFATLAAAALAANPPVPTTVGLKNSVDPNLLIQTCERKYGWQDPALPVHIYGDTYYVGSCGISSLLIVSPASNILIDGGTETNAKSVSANIERLGYRLSDVKYILNSHEH